MQEEMVKLVNTFILGIKPYEFESHFPQNPPPLLLPRPRPTGEVREEGGRELSPPIPLPVLPPMPTPDWGWGHRGGPLLYHPRSGVVEEGRGGGRGTALATTLATSPIGRGRGW